MLDCQNSLRAQLNIFNDLTFVCMSTNMTITNSKTFRLHLRHLFFNIDLSLKFKKNAIYFKTKSTKSCLVYLCVKIFDGFAFIAVFINP